MFAGPLKTIRRNARQAGKWPMWRRRRRGLTAIEYCFMLSLIMLAVLLAVQHVGSALKNSFERVDTELQSQGL